MMDATIKGMSRRMMLRASAAALAVTGVRPVLADMPQEGPDTPKLTMYIDADFTEADMRKLKQIGIDVVDIPNMPVLPWKLDWFTTRMAKLKTMDMSMGIVMTQWFRNGAMDPDWLKIVHNKPGRDEEIAKFKETIAVAAKAGLPVLEYNFFPHRANEGYHNTPARGGSTNLSFTYARMKDLPPLPSEGAVSYDQVWENYTYFLKQVVPVAAANRIRLSVHPNDPPPPISRGSGQILNSLSDWKRMIETVDSPWSGLTYDCGVTRELGEDPIAVCRYFGSRDRINQVHFRNVKLTTPRETYVEVANDEGDNDMFAVMRELVRHKYKRLIMPEHPRGLDNDQGQNNGGYTGWVYNVGYARAMLQTALMMDRGKRW
jgi:mannonate dehydratase